MGGVRAEICGSSGHPRLAQLGMWWIVFLDLVKVSVQLKIIQCIQCITFNSHMSVGLMW
jgi:hypothetical protein